VPFLIKERLRAVLSSFPYVSIPLLFPPRTRRRDRSCMNLCSPERDLSTLRTARNFLLVCSRILFPVSNWPSESTRLCPSLVSPPPVSLRQSISVLFSSGAPLLRIRGEVPPSSSQMSSGKVLPLTTRSDGSLSFALVVPPPTLSLPLLRYLCPKPFFCSVR